MAIREIITANCENGKLSKSKIARQWDDQGTLIQFAGYPEPETDEELIFRLIVWMRASEGAEPVELPPIELEADQWLISNYYTQLPQMLRFQLCITNEAGTYEKHSPIFSGIVDKSLSHNGEGADIDVIPLFDPYKKYVDELILDAGARVVDTELDETSTHLVENKAVASAVADVNGRLQQDETGIEELRDAVGIYTPPTASGTTPANRSNNVVLTPISLRRGHRYKYEVEYTTASDASSYLSMWLDGAETYFNVKEIPTGDTTGSREFDNVTNTDTAYMCINSNGRALEYTVKITDLSIEGNYITELQAKVGGLETKTGKMELDVSTIGDLTIRAEAETTTEDITDTLEYTVGSMNTDGSTTTSGSYYHTEKIPVNEGDIVFTNSQYTRYRVVTAFYNGAVVPESGTVNVFNYTVPSGVDSIVVTIYANQSRTNGTVNITGFGRKKNILENKVVNAEQNHSHTYAKRHPMVTFIDDDGNVEFYTYLLPIMRTYGVPMVSAYMGDSNPDMQSNALMMNKAQCDEVVRAGGELITHYNPSATSITLEEAEAVMLKSKGVLDKFGFSKASRLLAYSGGASNSDIRAMVSKHFDCSFKGAYPRVSNTDRSNHGCIIQYAIHREPCGGLYYDSDPASRALPYFKTMIDECIASNGWLVFTMHSWLMPPDKTKEEYGDTDQLGLLEDIIEYIQELQTGGSDIEIVTASKGLETFGNAWQAGDYLGHWNEQTFTTGAANFGDHSQPGCAINKLGQYDFPPANAIVHN